MRLDAMIFVFWMLSFKPAFSLFSFTFIKRLFSSSPLSAIRVVSSAYHLHTIWGYWHFSQQSWFQFVFHPAWHFAWCTLYIKLNKQDGNIQLWHAPFPIWNQSVVPCPVLTNPRPDRFWHDPRRGVMVESSDKTWSTEGNDKPLQHSRLENPMNTLQCVFIEKKNI